MGGRIEISLEDGASEGEILINQSGEMAILLPSGGRAVEALTQASDVDLRITYLGGRNRLLAVLRAAHGEVEYLHAANLPDDPKGVFQAARRVIVAEVDIATSDVRDIGMFDASFLAGRHLHLR